MCWTIAAAVRRGVEDWARSIGDVIKRCVKPARASVGVPAGAIRDVVRSRSELVAENAISRHQLVVLHRSIKRPRLRDGDRLAMVLLARMNSAWPDALHIVKPDTLLPRQRRQVRAAVRRCR